MSVKVMSVVWGCQELSGSEKLAMLAMADWCNDKGDSLYPSMPSIAKKINAGECWTRRLIHGLIDKGFLIVVGNHNGGSKGSTRQYKVSIQRLTTPVPEYTPIQESSPVQEYTPVPEYRDPCTPVSFTPVQEYTQTVSEPSVNHQDMSGKPDVVLSNGKQKFKTQAEEILIFLNDKTGKNYRPGKVNLDFIAERLKEGATPDECRQVIAKKAREWKGSEMEGYLRPATLFNRTKFAQYQGELI
jgi:uncharacterized phage protein (TIGR02220 family)